MTVSVYQRLGSCKRQGIRVGIRGSGDQGIRGGQGDHKSAFNSDLSKNIQDIVDGYASKPALVENTNYMVEKTYHLAQYLGAFGACLMPQ